MRDFTLKTYRKLLSAILEAGYEFQSFQDFITNPKERVVVLRHDVDLLPQNALATAEMEHGLSISGSYYFRIVPVSFDERIIEKIVSLGHEIGYHYENMDHCKGDQVEAIIDFGINLEYLRKFYPVNTICMHGSPRSRYDNKDIWKENNYLDFGVIGEPYFDVDYSKVFYLTDTGRQWDGFKFSIRDKITSQQKFWKSKGLIFHATKEIISAFKTNMMPEQIMITIHPQRWTDQLWPWIKELFWQKAKNWIKFLILSVSKLS